jgi:hypothetical protein
MGPPDHARRGREDCDLSTAATPLAKPSEFSIHQGKCGGGKRAGWPQGSNLLGPPGPGMRKGCNRLASIVIPYWNQLEFTRPCLAALVPLVYAHCPTLIERHETRRP